MFIKFVFIRFLPTEDGCQAYEIQFLTIFKKSLKKKVAFDPESVYEKSFLTS